MQFSRTFIIGTLLFSATAVATVVPRMSLADIAGSSERVVHAVVTKTWSDWDTSHRYIWTHYQLAVRDTLKGPVRASLVISEPGGVVDGVGMQVSGAPQFKLGEEVIVFAYQTPVDYWRVRGYSQGGFRVSSNTAGSRLVAPMSPSGLTLVGSQEPAAALKQPPLALSEFKAKVRALVQSATEVR